MKTKNLILLVLLVGLTIFAEQTHNETLIMIYRTFLGIILAFQIIRVVSLCMKEPNLFRYLILLVGTVLIGLLGTFMLPYLSSLAQSLPY